MRFRKSLTPKQLKSIIESIEEVGVHGELTIRKDIAKVIFPKLHHLKDAQFKIGGSGDAHTDKIY